MCSIKGCDAPMLAKGLCAKHYMRQRKHGKTNVVEKRGRKQNKDKAAQRQLMMPGGWSESTFERYWLAFKVRNSSGASDQERNQAIKNAARPSGSLNVSKLVRESWMLYFEAE